MRQAGCEAGRRRSQLLQPAVHVPLAALAGPRAALEAEPAQVVLEVLVVHWPVGLRLAQVLVGGGGKGGTAERRQ